MHRAPESADQKIAGASRTPNERKASAISQRKSGGLSVRGTPAKWGVTQSPSRIISFAFSA